MLRAIDDELIDFPLLTELPPARWTSRLSAAPDTLANNSSEPELGQKGCFGSRVAHHAAKCIADLVQGPLDERDAATTSERREPSLPGRQACSAK